MFTSINLQHYETTKTQPSWSLHTLFSTSKLYTYILTWYKLPWNYLLQSREPQFVAFLVGSLGLQVFRFFFVQPNFLLDASKSIRFLAKSQHTYSKEVNIFLRRRRNLKFWNFLSRNESIFKKSQLQVKGCFEFCGNLNSA